MNITHQKIEGSSQVASVGYDEPSKTLAVKFHSGGVYHYHDVPPEKHQEFLKAPSAGKFLGAHIKPAHKFTKIS